jgi:hypothetical protein
MTPRRHRRHHHRCHRHRLCMRRRRTNGGLLLLLRHRRWRNLLALVARAYTSFVFFFIPFFIFLRSRLSFDKRWTPTPVAPPTVAELISVKARARFCQALRAPNRLDPHWRSATLRCVSLFRFNLFHCVVSWPIYYILSRKLLPSTAGQRD